MSSVPIVAPHVEGVAARQAHADIPDKTFEREIGRDGFSGPATHLYHRNPPTAWTEIEGPIRPRAFLPKLAAGPSGTPFAAMPLFHNSTSRVRYWRIAESMDHLVRNADGDEMLFVHTGSAHLYCDYGHMEIGAGDYVILPRGTMWRLETSQATDIILVEATGSAFRLPDRGMIGRHAPFDPGVLGKPAIDEAFRSQKRSQSWTVRVKRGNRLGSITYPFNPLDAIGWKGDLYPVRLNVNDIRAVASHRLHLPPSVRTSFVADGFVVCSLAPRMVETDPKAMKLPFFHNNDDYDEIIFYHAGTMSSRGSMTQHGMFTFHPMGFTHGPHPNALKHMFDHPAKIFDGHAIAIDSREPYTVDAMPAGVEIAEYASSWREGIDMAPDAVR